MKIRKAHLMIVDDAGIHTHAFMDVIEHKDSFWLVPEWLDNSARTVCRPTRIISLARLRHHQTPGGNPEFLVEDPIPKYVFNGQIPPEQADMYGVVEYPEIDIPVGPRLN